MVRGRDERAFDLYLLLWKLACRPSGAETPGHDASKYPTGHGASAEIRLDYDTAAGRLGMKAMGKVAYRRQINKVLDQLHDRYALVSVKTGFNKDAQVRLSDASAAGETIFVPAGYWDYHWANRLTFPAKVMYALNLYYSSMSLSKPQWSMAAETIAKRHGLTRGFVITGTTALRRANLVDVVYDEGGQDADHLHRHSSVYLPLPLYDPSKLDAKWKALATKYGPAKTARARACANLVYKDSDSEAVEKFIDLEEKYGIDKIEQATAIITEKAPDNPKRCVGYFVRTIENVK